ncbi:hypothetical protein [Bifidobacterium sp. ESL0800]|uniref:hypothetical protein n=1 Tax=Bifidobacterium sp. ESL0800 TaxID=2983236 RepID=UPI0023F76CB0|nr:hypothetical protein [Bifidobacterium sp. ESL0800]WEV75536.1 hypothetical protein OZX75_07940 [Bifidobacterium sp. ESL0800]
MAAAVGNAVAGLAPGAAGAGIAEGVGLAAVGGADRDVEPGAAGVDVVEGVGPAAVGGVDMAALGVPAPTACPQLVQNLESCGNALPQ